MELLPFNLYRRAKAVIMEKAFPLDLWNLIFALLFYINNFTAIENILQHAILVGYIHWSVYTVKIISRKKKHQCYSNEIVCSCFRTWQTHWIQSHDSLSPTLWIELKKCLCNKLGQISNIEKTSTALFFVFNGWSLAVNCLSNIKCSVLVVSGNMLVARLLNHSCTLETARYFP